MSIETVFTKDAEVVTVGNYNFPFAPSIKSGNVSARDTGNQIFSYKKGADKYEWHVTYENLTNTNKSQLEAFFNNRSGSGEAFVWTDHNGANHNVRFIRDIFDAREVREGSWTWNLDVQAE